MNLEKTLLHPIEIYCILMPLIELGRRPHEQEGRHKRVDISAPFRATKTTIGSARYFLYDDGKGKIGPTNPSISAYAQSLEEA